MQYFSNKNILSTSLYKLKKKKRNTERNTTIKTNNPSTVLYFLFYPTLPTSHALISSLPLPPFPSPPNTSQRVATVTPSTATKNEVRGRKVGSPDNSVLVVILSRVEKVTTFEPHFPSSLQVNSPERGEKMSLNTHEMTHNEMERQYRK